MVRNRAPSGLATWRRAGALAVCVVAVLASGCDRSKGGAKHIPRDRDAQPVVVVEDPGAAASTTQEQEPNDEMAQATSLALGAVARGNLDGETDADLYRVDVTTPGVLVARLGGIEDVDLMLDLLDAEGTQLAHSDRGPARTVEGIANFPVEPGVYHLAVREFIRKRRRKQAPEPRTGPSSAYELAIEHAAEPAPGGEREPNEDATGAAEILVGDEVSGYAGWARDIDVWKVSVEGFIEQYSLDLDLSGVPGVTWTLEILDSGGAVVLRRKGEKDGGLSVRNLVPASDRGASGPAQRSYYARLEARRSNPTDPYQLRASTRLLELDEETEPNDEAGQGLALRDDAKTLEGKRRGFLTIGDVDQYRLAPGGAPMLLTVEVAPREEADVTVTVLAGSATLAMANAGGKGAKEYLADVRVPADQETVIQLSGAGGLGDAARYDMTWSLAAAPAGEPAEDLLDDYEEQGVEE